MLRELAENQLWVILQALAIFGNFKVIHQTMKEIAYNEVSRIRIW